MKKLPTSVYISVMLLCGGYLFSQDNTLQEKQVPEKIVADFKSRTTAKTMTWEQSENNQISASSEIKAEELAMSISIRATYAKKTGNLVSYFASFRNPMWNSQKKEIFISIDPANRKIIFPTIEKVFNRKIKIEDVSISFEEGKWAYTILAEKEDGMFGQINLDSKGNEIKEEI